MAQDSGRRSKGDRTPVFGASRLVEVTLRARDREMARAVLSGFSVCRSIGVLPREHRVFPKLL